MIPISDDNPHRRLPYVTWILVGCCVAVFLWQLTLAPDAEEDAVYTFGFVPANLLGESPYGAEPVWVFASLLSALFLHGGFLHLAGNMLYLWVFGNNVEDAMGHVRYLAFYLFCGIAASLAHGLVEPTSQIPVVGASGAISGLLASYVMIYPRTRITVIIPLGVILYPMKISALFVVGFWFVMQLFSAALSDPNEPGIAWWAHIGGFGAGLVLTPFLSQFPLFGRHRAGPWG